MQISFFKMEGCGNDYIFIDLSRQSLHTPLSPLEIQKLSNRHIGIGGDGVVILTPSGHNKVIMDMYNSDGSPSDMCGNALRCIALWKHQESGSTECFIQTKSGVYLSRILSTSPPWIEIEMPPPLFHAEQLPFLKDAEGVISYSQNQEIITACLEIDKKQQVTVYLISMGNPHCILFVEDMQSAPVQTLGEFLECHPSFPERVNVEFACQKKEALSLRTYERGSGETMACGSGACAAHVASVIVNGAPLRQTVSLKGGEMEIEWNPKPILETPRARSVMMRGPARFVYSGHLNRSLL